MTEPNERARNTSLVVRTAERFGLEANRFVSTVKATAFRTTQPITDEQLASLLIVAEQYHLNPFTKEIHAFVDDKRGGIVVPVVGVDGWLRIINEHPQFDGMDIEEQPDGSSCTVTIYRKDRTHPTRITEWLQYCKRSTAPWSQNPPRMIRHKATMQCGRYAFGFAGLYDEDEARRIVGDDDDVIDVPHTPRPKPPRPSAAAARVRSALAGPAESEASVIESGTGSVNQAPPGPATTIDDDGVIVEQRTLQQYLDEVLIAHTIEDAALVVDEARSTLNTSQLAELNSAYRARWVKED